MPDDSKESRPEETPESNCGPDPAANSFDEHESDAANDNTEDQYQETTVEPSGESRPPGVVRTTRDVNKLVPGVLTVHYIQRDVSLAVDGDAAIRAIATWNERHDAFTDPLHPERSSALNGWLGIDLQHVMGMTWMPSLGGDETRRVTIDPRP